MPAQHYQNNSCQRLLDKGWRLIQLEIEMGKKTGTTGLADERDRALDLLAGLHPCITIDGPPMAVAERIFDAVLADQADLKAQLKNARHTIELLQSHIGQLRRSHQAKTLQIQ